MGWGEHGMGQPPSPSLRFWSPGRLDGGVTGAQMGVGVPACACVGFGRVSVADVRELRVSVRVRVASASAG